MTEKLAALSVALAAAAGLCAIPPVAAATAPLADRPIARLHQIRSGFAAIETAARADKNASDTKIAQWYNWPNWANWRNF
jgi:hypothetical protein